MYIWFLLMKKKKYIGWSNNLRFGLLERFSSLLLIIVCCMAKLKIYILFNMLIVHFGRSEIGYWEETNINTKMISSIGIIIFKVLNWFHIPKKKYCICIIIIKSIIYLNQQLKSDKLLLLPIKNQSRYCKYEAGGSCPGWWMKSNNNYKFGRFFERTEFCVDGLYYFWSW